MRKFSPPHHHLSPSHTSFFPTSLAHVFDTDIIRHCDYKSLLCLSDRALTSSSHSNGHPEPKCIVTHLVSRSKAGLSCIMCYNYIHLACIRPRISFDTTWMLLSRHCSDYLLGTETSSDEPSMTGATSNEPVLDHIGVLSSAVSIRLSHRVVFRIPKSCRIHAGNALSDTIDNSLSSQTPLSWTKLFFGILTQSGNDHGISKPAQLIHDNFRRHLLTSSTDTPCLLWQLNHSPIYNRRSSSIPNEQRFRQLVNRHLSVDDVPVALWVITPDVLGSLQSKQPHAPSQLID